MEKAEQRKRLKRLQMIVHNRGDSEIDEVEKLLRAALDEHAETPPKRRGVVRVGHDREEKGGQDRAE